MLLSLPCVAGTVEHITMPSHVLGVDKPVTIYLPDGYGDTDKTYPVLYLLHGAWGGDRDWVDKGSAHEIADLTIRCGQAVPMVIVMPDARGTDPDMAGPNMGYFNQPGWNYEDYFYTELMPYVESNYRVYADKQHRAVAGLSMGGGAAVAYGQNYPDTWGAVCTLSGAVGDFGSPDNKDGVNNSRGGMARYNQLKFVQEADEDAVKALKTTRWYADCGDDDFLADYNIRFYSVMRQKGIPMEFRMRNGAHNWTYWRTALPDVLTFLSTGFVTHE